MPEKPSEKPIVTLTPEEAEALAKCGSDLDLNGLTHIDLPIAEALAKCGSSLNLDGLTHIDLPIAEALAKCGGYLSLNGLTRIDLPTAQALAKCGGILFLDGLTHIDAPTAQALAKCGSDLSLDGLTHIDAPIAEALAKCNGILYLDGLTRSDRKTAGFLLKIWEIRRLIVSEAMDDFFADYGSEVEDEDSNKSLQKVAHWEPLLEKHPNFKDIVVEEGAEIQQYLKENGVTVPERFHNLNAGRDAEVVIFEVMQFIGGQPNGFGKEAFSELFRSRTRKDFEDAQGFVSVYLDETLQALHGHLSRMISSCERRLKACAGGKAECGIAFLEEKINDPHLSDRIKRRYRMDLQKLLSQETCDKTGKLEACLKQAQNLLAKLAPFHLKRQGAVSYQLASRSTRDLTLGDKCSDCTSAKIHGMNFWTVPTWLTDPGFNFLLQYDEEGKLAHKFGLVWELKAEKGKQVPILTIDSMELANEQKIRDGMSEPLADMTKETRLTKEAMDFIRKWAADMGLDPKSLYASTHSNTGTMELDAEYAEKEVTITKLGVLDASRRILKKTNPEYQGQVRVYLQSLVPEDVPPGGQTNEEDEEEEGQGNVGQAMLLEGDRGRDFSKVEASLDCFLQSGSADADKIRSFLELARTDADGAARQMRVFLVTQAQKETKEALCVNKQRIDMFLHARGHSLEAYLKSILGQTEVARGAFIRAKLFHLVPKKK